MKLFLATKNLHKLREFQQIFVGTPIEIICENDLEFPIGDVEENGTTFEENAFIKAKFGAEATGFPTIADDSGLCVDYLDGEPGIYSARYAGGHGDSKANNDKLLSKLENVPLNKRTARFISAICCYFPDGTNFTVIGKCEGCIGLDACGQGGFGYDPIFISEKGCFGEISAEEKNKISHRSRAIEQLKIELKKLIKVE